MNHEIVKKMPNMEVPFPVALNLLKAAIDILRDTIKLIITNQPPDKKELLILQGFVADVSEIETPV